MARFEMNGRGSSRIVRFSGSTPSSDDYDADDVFGFSSGGSCSSGEWVTGEEVDDEDSNSANLEEQRAFWVSQEHLLLVIKLPHLCDSNSANLEEQRSFWVSQEHFLLATLYRTRTLETKIRPATKQALKEAQRLQKGGCSCSSAVAGSGCRSCLATYIPDQLQTQGNNSAICKSKWRNSSNILPGEHTYLQVIDNSNPRRAETKVIIELNLRGEFEMIKGSREYSELVSKQPQLFVGKSERLQGLVKILCRAGKRCMQDKNMHIGPRREERYMLAKWLGTCENVGQLQVLTHESTRRPVKPMTSMCNF